MAWRECRLQMIHFICIKLIPASLVLIQELHELRMIINWLFGNDFAPPTIILNRLYFILPTNADGFRRVVSSVLHLTLFANLALVQFNLKLKAMYGLNEDGNTNKNMIRSISLILKSASSPIRDVRNGLLVRIFFWKQQRQNNLVWHTDHAKKELPD